MQSNMFSNQFIENIDIASFFDDIIKRININTKKYNTVSKQERIQTA